MKSFKSNTRRRIAEGCSIVMLLLVSSFSFAQPNAQLKLKVGTAYTFVNQVEYNYLWYEPHFSLNQIVGLVYNLTISKQMILGMESLMYLRNTSYSYHGFVPHAFVSQGSDPGAPPVYVHNEHKDHHFSVRIPVLLRYRLNRFQFSAGPLAEWIVKKKSTVKVKGYNIFEINESESEPFLITSEERKVIIGGEIQASYGMQLFKRDISLGVSLTQNFTDYINYNIELTQPTYLDANLFLTFDL